MSTDRTATVEVTSRAFEIRPALSAVDIAEVRRLVHAHGDARSMVPGVEHVHADAERMPGQYVAPQGGLWLAVAAGSGVGCVALRPISDGVGEVKRMFVEAAWRGRGVGRALMETVIAGARQRGYHTLRLGTLDDMEAAQGLYRSLGFTPIARYRPDEMLDTRFYELPLDAPGRLTQG